MRTKTLAQPIVFTLIGSSLLLAACGASAPTAAPTSAPTAAAAATSASSDIASEPTATTSESASTSPDWFDVEFTDVQTGETFTMNDYAGQVVLVETMAIWCPLCFTQAAQVDNFHQAIGNPADLISVSLDVDPNEDAASLEEYASSYNFDWHFAIAPPEVLHDLGNLYSAQYLNPPLTPMLLIDRQGNVHQLDYGIKDADALQQFVAPYLAQN